MWRIDAGLELLDEFRWRAYQVLRPRSIEEVADLLLRHTVEVEENGRAVGVYLLDSDIFGLEPFEVHALAALACVNMVASLLAELDEDGVSVHDAVVLASLWGLATQYLHASLSLKEGVRSVSSAIKGMCHSAMVLVRPLEATLAYWDERKADRADHGRLSLEVYNGTEEEVEARRNLHRNEYLAIRARRPDLSRRSIVLMVEKKLRKGKNDKHSASSIYRHTRDLK